MQRITSKDNKKIKLLSKLLSSQKERNESGLFVLEGLRLIEDALKSGCEISEIYLIESFLPKFREKIYPLAKENCEIYIIDDFILPKVSDTKTPQGISAVAKGGIVMDKLPSDMQNGCLLLASLQDPGNVGTLIRSSAAFSLSCVIVTDDCPNITSPKVLRSSMGSIFKIPVVRYKDEFEALKALKERNIPVFAAYLGEDSIKLENVPLCKGCIAIGNEGNGLKSDFASLCDKKIIIPIDENSESLNAAVAGSIFAWELKKSVIENG